MKAIICKTYGPPDSLTFEDAPSPAAKEGEVVVSVKAASVNFPDVLIIENKYQLKPPLPFSPGSELAGVVKQVGTGVTTVQTPVEAVEGRTYGAGSIDSMVLWDRDRWGGKFAWAPGGSLGIGARSTAGNSVYLTGALGLDLRWYPIRVLGLALTPVRIEGGPKIRGQDEADDSPGVHGPPGSEYYLQAGSRIGIAFNAGIVDILVQGPTIAWSSSPFAAKEIMSVLLSIRLN